MESIERSTFEKNSNLIYRIHQLKAHRFFGLEGARKGNQNLGKYLFFLCCMEGKQRQELTFIGGFIRLHDHADERCDGWKHDSGDGGQHGGGASPLNPTVHSAAFRENASSLSGKTTVRSEVHRSVEETRRDEFSALPSSSSASEWSHLRSSTGGHGSTECLGSFYETIIIVRGVTFTSRLRCTETNSLLGRTERKLRSANKTTRLS
ncbi:hypothetical protein NPIL_471951 [Nephila pilipes]|uniref:Uncharacterized protein n=1 Tax=Nephila pilipes TaxID=299642 RepID=A0A8X6N407_NEPPI|nr:hypothetical protein NPIL_471951 [Nephila pilipes]